MRVFAFVLPGLVIAASVAAGQGANGRFSERRSSHFVLLQDVGIEQRSGWRGSRRFEQDVLATLEKGHARLDELLGLRPPRPIQVVVYDPEVFDATFGGLFPFPAAGFYHGVIRVRGDTRVTVSLQRTLHHELVHAVFDGVAPSVILPAWVNEGFAEWFEQRVLGKRHLSRGELAALSNARATGALFPLTRLNVPSFASLSGDASLAYLQSYGVIEFLARRHGEDSLARFCEVLLRTRNLDRALQRVYRRNLAKLEADFFADLR